MRGKPLNWYFMNMFFILMLILFISAYREDLRFVKFLDYNNITLNGTYFVNVSKTHTIVENINFTNPEENIINVININFTQERQATIQLPKATNFKLGTIYFISLIILPFINFYYLIKWIKKKTFPS